MTAVPATTDLVDRELQRRSGSRRARRMEHSRSGGEGLTLEARISRVWEGLLAAGAAECPVCGGRMERSGTAGRCLDCASRLA